MVANPYPIPRELRQSAILVGDGGAAYGPFTFQIFDEDDVELWVKAQGQLYFSLVDATVQKMSGLPLDFFTITAAVNIPATSQYQVISKRIGLRTAGVTKGTVIDPAALEKELSKYVTVQQELRRDVLRVDPAVADGDTLMLLAGRLVKGPSGTDIINAQPNALAAAASAALAAKWAYNGDLDVTTGRKAAEYYARKAQEALASGVAGVSSFLGRVGAVVAVLGDYTSDLITRPGGGTVEDALTSLFSKVTNPWLARAIGEIYMVDTSNTGAQIPPASDPDTVWIELTAGLTGVGGYNYQKLTGESVSGSAPLVIATATISVSGSVMNGVVIDLINTDSRILRPSTSPGTKQNDALQNITGSYKTPYSRIAGSTVAGALYLDAADTIAAQFDYSGGVTNPALKFDASRVARTATETRMKNVGVKAYMRVK